MTGKEYVGKRIKAARDLAGLTQAELADRTGLGPGGQMISNYERGKTEPPAPRLRRIAEATRQPLTFFFFSDDADNDEASAIGPAEEAAGLLHLARIEELIAQLPRELNERLDELNERLDRIEHDLAELRRARGAGEAENGG